MLSSSDVHPARTRRGTVTTEAHTSIETNVLDVIRTMIGEIVGEEYALDLEIDLDTSFEDDLELESIEFVKLGAKLTEHYGGNVDFAAFLADKDLDEIIEMRVGEVVGYIIGATAGASTDKA
jgi:acyl carrier protein